MREGHSTDYDSCQYTCVEISPQLAALQQETVAEQHDHRGRFTVEQRDAADLSSWAAMPAADPTFVLMAEVLDNLPHDRCVRAPPHAAPVIG